MGIEYPLYDLYDNEQELENLYGADEELLRKELEQDRQVVGDQKDRECFVEQGEDPDLGLKLESLKTLRGLVFDLIDEHCDGESYFLFTQKGPASLWIAPAPSLVKRTTVARSFAHGVALDQPLEDIARAVADDIIKIAEEIDTGPVVIGLYRIDAIRVVPEDDPTDVKDILKSRFSAFSVDPAQYQ